MDEKKRLSMGEILVVGLAVLALGCIGLPLLLHWNGGQIRMGEAHSSTGLWIVDADKKPMFVAASYDGDPYVIIGTQSSRYSLSWRFGIFCSENEPVGAHP